MKSSPKCLLGYMLKSRMQQDEGTKTMEIGSILVTKEDETKRILAKKIFDFVIETSKLEEFKEIAIHPDHPNQKVQIRREMSRHLRGEVIHFLSSHLHNFAWCTQDM